MQLQLPRGWMRPGLWERQGGPRWSGARGGEGGEEATARQGQAGSRRVPRVREDLGFYPEGHGSGGS